MTPANKYFSLILLALSIYLSGCFNNDMKAFQNEIALKADTLNIDNSKDTAITGSKGTVLFFPKNIFVFADGTFPKESISIQLKECFTLPEMIRENLTTMSGNQLLETRGMIYVIALSDGKELQLREGKSYIIHFPKDTAEKNKIMNLYFGNNDKDGNVNWKIDTQSILKPIARIIGTSWAYTCTSKENEDFFTFRDDTTMNLSTYFDKKFDDKKLSLGYKLLNKSYLFSFTKLKNGDLINKRVIEVANNSFSTEPVKNQEVDSYVIQFFNSTPALNPNFCKDALDKTEGSIRIDFTSLPDYRNQEDYNNLFNRKYSVFKNQSIKVMNDAELNYYIFSSSKLGWINCDYFWKTEDEKIDYIVKVDPNSKPNIKLIFEQAKSIMSGNLEGEKYVFRNVPINQDIKIVAIKFNGSQPLLSVMQAKTSKQIFDKFQFKDFTIADLEREFE